MLQLEQCHVVLKVEIDILAQMSGQQIKPVHLRHLMAANRPVKTTTYIIHTIQWWGFYENCPYAVLGQPVQEQEPSSWTWRVGGDGAAHVFILLHYGLPDIKRRRWACSCCVSSVKLQGNMM